MRYSVVHLESILHPQLSVVPDALVFGLHGRDANKNALLPFAMQFRIPSLQWVLPSGPFVADQSDERRQWFDTKAFSAYDLLLSRKSLLRLLQYHRDRGIPASKFFLVGFSQGAAMALDVALRFPLLLGGVIAMSGFIIEPDALARERTSANEHVPIFIGHGTRDESIPIEEARADAERLRSMGYSVAFHEYDTGHHIPLAEVRDVAAFIQRQLHGMPAS